MKQISVVSEDKPGVVAQISEVLAHHHININSLDAETFGQWAVTLVTVDKYDEAVRALRSETNFRILTEDVILVRIEDRPGALAKLARLFRDQGINIRSMRIIQRGVNDSAVAISTDKTKEALELVKDILIS
ncbi:MAG TPA: hypothetical protein DCZ03_03710 [Gammaproteobacteria bacterium]|nr:hypothetical protein [Gammaproteobacteria bacterium]